MSELGARSAAGLGWSLLAFASARGLNLATTVVIARLLAPAEVGLMAVCLVVLAVAEVFSRFGLGPALVSDRGDEREAGEAVLLLSVLFSLAVAAALWAGAGPLSGWLGVPDAAALLRVLCLVLVVDGVSGVLATQLARQLRFERRLLPELVRAVAKGTVAIALALGGLGVWALVWGHVAGALAHAAALAVVNPWRPRALPGPAAAGRVLRFGASLIGAQLLGGLERAFPAVLLSRAFGSEAVGLYTIAARIPQLTLESFGSQASAVTHPVMATIASREAALRQYSYGCFRYLGLVALPAGMALAVLSAPLVEVLYTPEWHAMIPVMQWLCVALSLTALTVLPAAVCKAMGRPGIVLATSALTTPAACAALWAASGHGLAAIAATQAGVSALSAVAQVAVLRRVLGVEPARVARALLPGLGCAAAVGLAASAAAGAAAGVPALALAAGIAAAGAAYAASICAFDPEAGRSGLRLAREAAGGASPGAGRGTSAKAAPEAARGLSTTAPPGAAPGAGGETAPEAAPLPALAAAGRGHR